MSKNVEKTIHYRGDRIVMIDRVPNSFCPGAIVNIDANGDGVFEHQVTTDADGLYTISIDATPLPLADKKRLPVGTVSMFTRSADGTKKSEVVAMNTLQISSVNPAGVVPVKSVSTVEFPFEPGICTCTDCCPSSDTLIGSSLGGYTHSYTPTEHGVELATGKLRYSFPVTAFGTQQLGFNFQLHHSSLVDYNGPFGQSFSHSFNMMIVQTGELTGLMITPDLRCYDIVSEDGETWELPCGFYSRLTLDTARHRWALTHFSGLEVVFYQGVPNAPGYPMSIRDPNGNTTQLEYDTSGLLQQIITDLSQVQTLKYSSDSLLSSFIDHLGRTWHFKYDAQRRLTQIVSPDTEYADIKAAQEISDSDLTDLLVTGPRVRTVSYTDKKNPNHITSVMDPRGAIPQAFTYDEVGRVDIARINEKDVCYHYEPEDGPLPLERLEATNLLTRVIDREGNITDYEIHGSGGGPLDGHGKYGIRRTVTWTERGKGNAPLREDEPEYWEQRWLHDCECLSPIVSVQPFRSDNVDGLEFDENNIPNNWPRDLYTFNDNRQVTFHEYTDGTNSIATRSTYQTSSFGDKGQFSRLLSRSDPREFDKNPIYASLNFVHTYAYDQFGNRLRHDAPTVTRGVNVPQTISESWTYNLFGQMLTHTDPNGNLTVHTYYEGPSSGGDINTKGEFGGYLNSVTRGADGSTDSVTNLTTTSKVNALGMITQENDPKGFTYDTEYNDLQEMVRRVEPLVALRNGLQVRYETRHIYDGAGNQVLVRRSNIDVDGTVSANDFIDRSMSYDAVNNLLSERVEVDENDNNDLITRKAYDGNDDLIITQKPEGDRTFDLYDEQRRPYKTFYGVAPGLFFSTIGHIRQLPVFDKRRLFSKNFFKIPLGSTITVGYPTDKRAETLGRIRFVGLTIATYDARRNQILERDGRGNFKTHVFDFANRQIAYSDQNGNGWVREYDDASNVLTTSKGAVLKSGQITKVLERTYARFDEVGRQYQHVFDIDPNSNESAKDNPDDGRNSSHLTAYDPGSRTVMKFDANGNPTSYTYDAADRLLTTTDALKNMLVNTYDANSNIVSVKEIEVPGPGATGSSETYVKTCVYDELNRRTEEHIRGLNGNSIDHASFFAFDSQNNLRLMQDPEDIFTLTKFDYFDRQIMTQRFAGDPFTKIRTELLHYECAYDKNSNKTEVHALSDVNDPKSVQITKHAYDHLDRPVRTVYPDSDDPIDGSGNDADGIFDRVEIVYDANSNPIQVTDSRGVVFNNTFDPGNRPTEQNITLPTEVPGTTKQTFVYDALDRVTSASNNYAKIDRAYDAFSRLTAETQSVRLDGSGFTNGWEHPIQVANTYDKQSNRNGYRVLDGATRDLDISTAFDALNRVECISAGYFNRPNHDIARYAYFGAGRVQTKTLGNGAALTCTYDLKRRLQTHQWNGPNRMLVGFEYGHDRMDNPLFERFTHDMGLCDHFQYNHRYEITGVSYRVPGPIPLATFTNAFDYDDNYNRRQANFGNPFDATLTTSDSYVINKANEYTQLTRNGDATTPTHDRAGNATSFLVRPVTSKPDQQDVMANARWDACSLLFDIDPGGVNPQQHYRYDPLRRRIVTMELDGTAIGKSSKRYIYDGWSVVEERLFEEGATLEAAPSTLERIYVNGKQIDEPLLAAIDRNQDGEIGRNNDKNVRDITADQEYYFLNNRLGSIMALLDADKADRVLEYYRYTILGEPTVLPVVDDDSDGLEDTPLDLSDNFNQTSLRSSEEFGNVYHYTGRRFDGRTGLYYYRNRYYESRSGRFLSRDPLQYIDSLNLLAYVTNKPASHSDPTGLLKDKCPGVLYVNRRRAGSNARWACGHARDATRIEGSREARRRCQAAAKKDQKCIALFNRSSCLEELCTRIDPDDADFLIKLVEEATAVDLYIGPDDQQIYVCSAGAMYSCIDVEDLKKETQEIDTQLSKVNRQWSLNLTLMLAGAAAIGILAKKKIPIPIPSPVPSPVPVGVGG
ncbi:MAG: hypothetical protein NPIRA04_18240 [Nitrospirales bacterium]|nr:MAG: hypothetical protein NPIRA04_18240 [Nitrospirales bacterium]